MPRKLTALFLLRCVCFVRGDGSLESPENIGRNGAKLIYLTKWCCLSLLASFDDLYQYILDHMEVIDVSRHYVCSFLILVTGQAKDISMNTKFGTFIRVWKVVEFHCGWTAT